MVITRETHMCVWVTSLGLVLGLLCSASEASSTVWYVDKDAVGGLTGRSWANAFDELAKALSLAEPGAQIWVAEGQYLVTTTLEMKDGVSIYGGFSGNETSLTQRDFANHKVIIDGNNSVYHVLHMGYFTQCRLDGLTITGGRALGTAAFTSSGGGLYCSGSDNSNIIANCKFLSNAAHDGGAVYLYSAAPQFISCEFTNNVGIHEHPEWGFGGAIRTDNGWAKDMVVSFTQCVFSNNAAWRGGAVHLGAYLPAHFLGCVFSDNHTTPDASIEGDVAGGAASIEMGSETQNPVTFERCVFRANVAGGYPGGGAILAGNQCPELRIINCLFSENSSLDIGSDSGGGAIMLWGLANPIMIVNSTFYDNSADNGGAIYNHSSGNVNLVNSILWNSGTDPLYTLGGHTTVSFSDVQGGYQGTGNIAADPVFSNSADDFRLQSMSPCKDTGTADNMAPTDIRGARRPQGAEYDMGAYEIGVVADFLATPILGRAPLAVHFSDVSTTDSPPIIGWTWDFGDANASTDRNPVHTYDTPGTYAVSLSLSSSDQFSDSETKAAYITVLSPEPPEANFYITNASGRPPHEVHFTDASKPGDSPIFNWAWDFGDGRTISGFEPNPAHVYDFTGVYTVSLTVTTSAGSSTRTATGAIFVSDHIPLAPWSLLVTAITITALALRRQKTGGQGNSRRDL
jgi:PKD repeat protein